MAALWRGLLRMPSQRPQKGRQAIRDVVGDEGWAGADGDFARAVVVTPAVFTWKRAVRSLVELPALWSTLPLIGRDPDELWAQAREALGEHGVPLPHHVIADDATLTLLWRIEPLRRPREGKPAFHFRCFEDQLQYWRWAVLKLSYLFEPLGARPLDPALVDDVLLGFVPLPPLPGSGLVRHAAELGLRPARLLPVVSAAADAAPVVPDLAGVAPSEAPLRIAAVSKPLRRANERLFQALGRPRPGRRRWCDSQISQAARQPQGAGARHPAAVKLACAHRWDGLSREASLAALRAWAATCERDGAFPARAGDRDELEALVDWAEQTLQPGGPTPRGDAPARRRQRRRTSRDHVAAAVCGFLAEAGGAFAGTLAELGKRAALWSLDHGVDQPVPLRTLKRAVVDLVGAGELVHDVVRAGVTWASCFRLGTPSSSLAPSSSLGLVEPALPDRDRGDPGQIGLAEGQQAESMWAPALLSAGSGSTNRGGSGGAFPLPGGSGGDSSPSPVPSAAPAPLPPSSSAGSTVEQASAASASPRQRRLPWPRASRLRAARRGPGEGLPPVDESVVHALADVGRGLSSADHRALLEEARAGLFARPRVLGDFAGALRRRALRLLRLREIAAASAAHLQARQRAEARALQRPPLVVDDRPPDEVFAAFRQMLAAQVRPLHERTPAERARRLHADGLSLLALPPRSKKPSSSWKPQQTTRQSLPRLEQELAGFGAEAGLAVVCGEVSGVVVADFDDAVAVDWARRHLPATPWRTKTARGEHWYFRLPVDPSGALFVPPASLPWKGELRAAGHYVVAPGSWHPDGVQYQAVGDWSVSRDALPEWPGLSRVDDALLQRRGARQRILRGE